MSRIFISDGPAPRWPPCSIGEMMDAYALELIHNGWSCEELAALVTDYGPEAIVDIRSAQVAPDGTRADKWTRHLTRMERIFSACGVDP